MGITWCGGRPELDPADVASVKKSGGLPPHGGNKYGVGKTSVKAHN